MNQSHITLFWYHDFKIIKLSVFSYDKWIKSREFNLYNKINAIAYWDQNKEISISKI